MQKSATPSGVHFVLVFSLCCDALRPLCWLGSHNSICIVSVLWLGLLRDRLPRLYAQLRRSVVARCRRGAVQAKGKLRPATAHCFLNKHIGKQTPSMSRILWMLRELHTTTLTWHVSATQTHDTASSLLALGPHFVRTGLLCEDGHAAYSRTLRGCLGPPHYTISSILTCRAVGRKTKSSRRSASPRTLAQRCFRRHPGNTSAKPCVAGPAGCYQQAKAAALTPSPIE